MWFLASTSNIINSGTDNVIHRITYFCACCHLQINIIWHGPLLAYVACWQRYVTICFIQSSSGINFCQAVSLAHTNNVQQTFVLRRLDVRNINYGLISLWPRIPSLINCKNSCNFVIFSCYCPITIVKDSLTTQIRKCYECSTESSEFVWKFTNTGNAIHYNA